MIIRKTLTSIVGLVRSIVFFRITAILPLTAVLALPFMPESACRYMGIQGATPCDTLAHGFTMASIWLMIHRTVFVLNRSVSMVPIWLGQLMGVSSTAVVFLAIMLTRHGVPEILVSAATVCLTASVFLVSSVMLHRNRFGWAAKTVICEMICLAMICWALAVVRLPHFDVHDGFVVSVVAGAVGFHTLVYAFEFPQLLDLTRGKPRNCDKKGTGPFNCQQESTSRE